MTTYNSYEAAKIAMPLACIVHDTDNNRFFGMPSREGTILTDDGCKFAEAKDHCMSMLTFSELGHKLVDGDLYQNEDGRVFTVGRLGYEAKYCNLLSSYCFPSKISILRAAALETKEPKRTKVEWVKWNFECAWHAIKAFEDGEKLYTKRSSEDFVLIDNAPDVLRYLYDLHERIETPIEWWEDAAEFVKPLAHAEVINDRLLVEAAMTRDQWCDFARILLEQGE